MSRALVIVGAAGLGLAALYIVSKGGAGKAAEAIGAGAVDAVGGAVRGGVGAVGAAVGLPTPAETTTDTQEARWLIDNVGHFEASKWAGALAYGRALFAPAGSGRPPAPGSAAGIQFAAVIKRAGVADTGDESARLLARYPASRAPDAIYGGFVGPIEQWEPPAPVAFERAPGY